MRVLRDPLDNDRPPRGGVLSIGNFDGVHVGHQAVLRHVVRRAGDEGSVALAMTFDPHPAKVLRPAEAPRLLSTLEQRLQLIAGTGIEVTMVVPFTRALAQMEAEAFVRRVMVERLGVVEVYIGANFRFGADRGGDVELLRRLGRELGFTAASAPTVEVDGEVVSSSRVRAEVATGRVEAARRLLGRAVAVDGHVREGERLGRTLGFPTLNLAVENDLLPHSGVYITAADVPSDGRVFPSVTNIGVRPTVSDRGRVSVESHLLGFDGDLYGQRVRVHFIRRLRDERTFASAGKLMEQIHADTRSARAWFEEHPVEDHELLRM